MKTFALVSLTCLALTTIGCSDGSSSNDNNADATAVNTPAAVADTTVTQPVVPAAGEGDAVAQPVTPVGSNAPVVDNTVTPPAPVVHEAVSLEIDATNKTEWAHFDLDTGKMVAATDASWDLAFKRTSIKMNSDVKAKVLIDTTFEAIAKAPEGEYAADAPVAGGLETDGLFFHSPSAWYSYNIEVHVISSRNYVYVVKTNGGQDVKVFISDYYNLDRLPAFIQLKTQILGLSAPSA